MKLSVEKNQNRVKFVKFVGDLKMDIMLAVNGIYDGKNIRLTDEVNEKKKYRVVVTFIEEIDQDSELRDFSGQTKGLDFWHDEREDLYQDYLNNKS
jgi:hypothetical protein